MQTRFTLQELQEIVHTKEKQLFQRAWLPCSAILSETSKTTKNDTLHVTLQRISDTNQYKWSVAVCDHKGNVKPIFSKKFTVAEGQSYYLSTGSLPDEILQCEITKQGLLSIKSLFCDINFIVHTNVDTVVQNAQCLQSIYFDSSKKVVVAGECVAKQDVIAYSDIELLEGAKLQTGRNVALLTTKICHISQGEISAGGVLKVYAPNELSYDLTKMRATRMIDITLQNASQMIFVNNYKHNLTYAVLSSDETNFTLLESIKMQQGLYILAPFVTFKCGVRESDPVVLVSQKTYMHIAHLGVDKAVLHADFLGLRCKKATVGEIYPKLPEEELQKTSQSVISVNNVLVMSKLETLDVTGGSILVHGGSAYVDSTTVTLVDGKFISTAANTPVFMATRTLFLDLKTEDIDCSKNDYVKDVNNDGYKLIKSLKLRTNPSYFSVSHSYLHIPTEAAIVNKGGNFKANLAGHIPETTSFEQFNKYAVVKYVTTQVRVARRRWSGFKTGNKYANETTITAQPDQVHNAVIYKGTSLIEGTGDLPVGANETETYISANVLAPQRDLITSGKLHVGLKTVAFDASSLQAEPIAQLDNSLYSVSMIYQIDPAATKYLYKPIVPIRNIGTTHSEILILKDGCLSLETTTSMLLEFTPTQEVSAIPELFLSKYRQMNLIGLSLSDMQLREWLLNNSKLFFNEAIKVDGKVHLTELANLARPIIYYTPHTITLPDNTTKIVLRLQPQLPNFMVDKRLLMNMGTLSVRSAILNGPATVTGLLKIEKNLTLDQDAQDILLVQKFLYEASVKVTELERIGNETHTPMKDLLYKIAQPGGIVEVGGNIEGRTGSFISKGAEWNVGGNVGVRANTLTSEPVEEQRYQQHTSTGYTGRRRISKEQYLAQRSGVPTTFNVSGSIRIETLVGDIIDKSTVFNSLDTPELIALRGSLIKEVIAYVNDKPIEYSQEKAKNWIDRNLCKEKVLNTLAVATVVGSVYSSSYMNAVGLAVAAVLAGIAIAAEHELVKDAKKKANGESNAATAKISRDHNASIKRLKAMQNTLLDKAAKVCQDAKNKVTYQLTKNARTTQERQAAQPDIDRIHAEISVDYERRTQEIRNRASADIDKATTDYNRALAENTARYNATIEGINLRPGTTVGIGVQANAGTTGADVRGTYTTGYGGRSATAVTAPLFNYTAPSATYTSQSTQQSVQSGTQEDEEEIYPEFAAPEVTRPREEYSYARLSTSAMEEDYFADILPAAPVTEEAVVRRSVAEYMRDPSVRVERMTIAMSSVNDRTETSPYRSLAHSQSMQADSSRLQSWLSPDTEFLPASYAVANGFYGPPRPPSAFGSETVGESLLISSGRFFVRAGQGITQFGMEQGVQFGLVSPMTLQRYTAVITREERLYASTPVAQSISGIIGQYGTEFLVYSFIPVGAGLRGWRLMAGGGVSGFVIGGTQPVYGDNTGSTLVARGYNAVTGGIVGAIATPAIGLVSVTSRKFITKMFERHLFRQTSVIGKAINPQAQEMARVIEGYLGKNFKMIINPHGDPIFISVDNLRKIRFDAFDPHGYAPHGHIEYFNGKRWTDLTEVHLIELKESSRLITGPNLKR